MNIPPKFDSILNQNQALHAEVTGIVASFEPIYKNNTLYFFEEYTDHGIEHVEKVLMAAEFIIPENSFQHIKPKEIGLLIPAILLHDIGMHAGFATFKALLAGDYDNIRIKSLDTKTWNELWADYLSESRHFSSLQRENIFGDADFDCKEPNLSDKDLLNGADKKLIGEFIRRHHARLAHEIALNGFIGDNGGNIPFGTSALSLQDKQFAGIIARSHGINIRDTFAYLMDIAYGTWKHPADMNIVFLMVILRIADYLQIDNTRTNANTLKLKTFNSPVSLREHRAHLAISHITFENEDPELISVTCTPSEARMYVKLATLIKDIQNELDISWAILGEIYGFLPRNQPQIRFRRISSNLDHPNFLKQIDYIPQEVSFKVNNELSKLLVSPLYGNKPHFGVRELVQNATDACKEYARIAGNGYTPIVIASVLKDKGSEGSYLFKITDNGKGMTQDEILNYFLTIGSSFRDSYQWKKEFIDEEGNCTINRNGRFGIGVLAAFLIGDEISVTTKSYKEIYTYSFKTKINSQFVEIKKEEIKRENGTEITIPVSPHKIKKFTPENPYGSQWSRWYIDTFPKVEYYSDLGKIKITDDFKPEKTLRTIFPEHYTSVKWGYQRKLYRKAPPIMIACNGIVITNSSRNVKFPKHSIPRPIISARPSLVIEDLNGMLPLRLDRNEIDSKEFSFDNELLSDISKDFIADLLTLKIPRDRIDNIEIPPHNTLFLYAKNGFYLASDYVIDKLLQNDKLSLLRILSLKPTIIYPDGFDFPEETIILPEFNRAIHPFSRQNGNVAPETGGRILIKKENYNILFYAKIGRNLSPQAKINHTVEWENDNYVIYNLEEYPYAPQILKEDSLIPIINQNEEIQSIQEMRMEYLNLRKHNGGDILNKLFEEYFGDNILIPYDMEERKKIYAKAFNDLEKYMPQLM